ncbi:MAG: ribosome small subunit-dependent GTPase A [Tissierellia bacterium]|nr:ribosome small subunit-dependent GTPase A [Tissierellia bacterium]
MHDGTIVKLVRGIYYVYLDGEIIPCKARGLFREQDVAPVVGDKVQVRIAEEDGSGYIEKVYPRSSYLIRPYVANIDLALMVFSIKSPDLNLYLLDKNLVMSEYLEVQSMILLTKTDLSEAVRTQELKDIYESIGYRVLVSDGQDTQVIRELQEILSGKITAVAGPSGVGKSTLINRLIPGANLETSAVSQKTTRGRHTTRHTELIPIDQDSYILDTPGFSALDLDFLAEDVDLPQSFPEFTRIAEHCRFRGCMHLNEPDCAVKGAVTKGSLPRSRYENYLIFYEEMRKSRRY